MVTAHGDPYVLRHCLSILDSEKFDFYIHVDAKTDVDYSPLCSFCQYSKVVLTERVPVYWRDYSLIKSVLILLEAAVKGNYDYYHLISGVDLPIKTPEEIDSFFTANRGSEFIKPFTTFESFRSNANRVVMKYPLVRKYKRNNHKLIDQFQKLLISRVFRFPKSKEHNVVRSEGWKVYAGENWFSVTDDFAKYLLGSSDLIERYFSEGYAADEVFPITILMNSAFKDRLSSYRTRYIDWSRGKPYVWRTGDEKELMNCGSFFARKFDASLDSAIVSSITDAVLRRKAGSAD